MTAAAALVSRSRRVIGNTSKPSVEQFVDRPDMRHRSEHSRAELTELAAYKASPMVRLRA
jgi:hypothetical protein